MAKKHKIDEEDQKLFRSVMEGVKPLAQTKVIQHQTPPNRKSQSSFSENRNPFNLFDEEQTEEIFGETSLEFHRGGLQHKVLRKLRQGKYNVEAILDMHGMRVAEAKEALNYFILNCLKKDIRHVLIIHGKGRITKKPILKNKVNQWLRQIEYVLAFCSATAEEGRTGAVYVLLKGRRSIDG